MSCENSHDAWPAWASEPTAVVPYDPRWPRLAAAHRARLTTLLSSWLVDGVEHVGSTAVPGLAAKPIIDLMASVRDPDTVAQCAAERLGADGWCPVPPELDRRPWRRFFVQPDASGRRRVAHLHVIPAGHARWAEQIAFRDTLRLDHALAGQYEALKRRLAERHRDDREAYTIAKTEFITKVLRSRHRPPTCWEIQSR